MTIFDESTFNSKKGEKWNENLGKRITNKNKNEEYWGNYGKKYETMPIIYEDTKKLISQNENGLCLYKIEGKLVHIIWVYNNLEKIPVYKISEPEWENLINKPEIIEKINHILIDIYNCAIDLYAGKDKPKGFVIGGIEAGNFGLPVGAIAGIRVNYEKLIKPLIKAIERKDEENIKKQQGSLFALLVHELKHHEQGDGMFERIRDRQNNEY